MLDRRAVEAEEERLRALVARLPDERRAAFHRASRERLRDPDTYAVLNWFFLVGLHHFYLGRHGRGLLDVGLVALGIGLIVAGYWMSGLIPIAAVLVIELYALFRSQVIVQDWNNRIQREILHEQGDNPHAGD